MNPKNKWVETGAINTVLCKFDRFCQRTVTVNNTGLAINHSIITVVTQD